MDIDALDVLYLRVLAPPAAALATALAVGLALGLMQPLLGLAVFAFLVAAGIGLALAAGHAAGLGMRRRAQMTETLRARTIDLMQGQTELVMAARLGAQRRAIADADARLAAAEDRLNRIDSWAGFGYLASEHQKMKLAAIEGMWETQPAPASFTLVGIPDMEERTNHYAIHIPWVMGLIGTRSLMQEIPGILELVDKAEDRIRNGIIAYDALQDYRAAPSRDAVPPESVRAFEEHGDDMGYALLLTKYVEDPRGATEEQIAQAAWDTVPHVPTLFWAFRIMVGIGFVNMALMAAFVMVSARGTITRRPCPGRVAHGRRRLVADGADSSVHHRRLHPALYGADRDRDAP
ncbi:bd-type cytochrome oxidase subunit I [Paracoccus pantotrophus]|uniref:Bd-type cytochrome oxidase subunit I n=1 Tax=Paracoccus pantotrophus TaxID=82367 RepID=A0ABX9S7V4_PARPN|nr:cytochrome ubiquinol oxidase subunit I [Paracoccus pantotrophus]RKS43140.1 bd-type cytochrome oxidase subunit I [Paracoccus pantotrophus]